MAGPPSSFVVFHTLSPLSAVQGRVLCLFIKVASFHGQLRGGCGYVDIWPWTSETRWNSSHPHPTALQTRSSARIRLRHVVDAKSARQGLLPRLSDSRCARIRRPMVDVWRNSVHGDARRRCKTSRAVCRWLQKPEEPRDTESCTSSSSSWTMGPLAPQVSHELDGCALAQ